MRYTQAPARIGIAAGARSAPRSMVCSLIVGLASGLAGHHFSHASLTIAEAQWPPDHDLAQARGGGGIFPGALVVKRVLTPSAIEFATSFSGVVMIAQLGGDIRYSLVIPVYNEQAVLPMLLRRIDILLNEMLDGPAEAIFVDDGSTDCSSIV